MLKPYILLPRTIIALSVFLLCTTSETFACILTSPFDIAVVDSAEVIFRGRVVKYETFQVKYDSAHKVSHTTAKMTFEVDKTYKGDQSVHTIELLWWGNWVQSVPREFSKFVELYGRDFVVGAVKGFSWRGHSPPLNSSNMNLREVIQGPCSPPFMFEYMNGHLTGSILSTRTKYGVGTPSPETIADLEKAFRARGLLE